MQQVAVKTAQSTVQGTVPANRLKPSIPSTINTPLSNIRFAATPNQVVRKNLTIPEQLLQKQMISAVTATTGQTSAGMNTLLQGPPQRGAVAAAGLKVIGKAGHPNQAKEKQKSTAYYSSASG